MPSSRTAALMRAIHSARKVRFLLGRSRYAYCPAFISACLATRKTFFLRPRKPLVCLKTFLWRARAVTPRFTLGMARSSGRVRQHAADRCHVGRVDSAAPGHLALPLGGFFCGEWA